MNKKIYAFLNQKGGVGKSTTAGHFAYWLKEIQSVNTVFIDADGQRSASPWMESLNLPVFALSDPEELMERLPAWRDEYDAVVVDGPGNAGETTKAILGRCDIAIVPNRPSSFDLCSSGKIVQYVRHASELRSGKPVAAFFLNAASGERSILLREAKDVLGNSPIPLLEPVILNLTCIADAPGQQETVFTMKGKVPKQAADAYIELFNKIVELG